jgi:hypothetical protein
MIKAPVQNTWYRLIQGFNLTVATEMEDLLYLTSEDDFVVYHNVMGVHATAIIARNSFTLVRILYPPRNP